MDEKRIKHVSKFLSLVLRHQPELIGITLDEQGWVEIDILLRQAALHGNKIDRKTLDQVVLTSDKQRFAISQDGQMIRANQGHSTPQVRLTFPPAIPPEKLFHGTVANSIDGIKQNGLRAMSRHHVHLSPDRVTATVVGARRGKPLILTIDSRSMHQDGFMFYRSENGVWLTDSVPANYISFAESQH